MSEQSSSNGEPGRQAGGPEQLSPPVENLGAPGGGAAEGLGAAALRQPEVQPTYAEAQAALDDVNQALLRYRASVNDFANKYLEEYGTLLTGQQARPDRTSPDSQTMSDLIARAINQGTIPRIVVVNNRGSGTGVGIIDGPVPIGAEPLLRLTGRVETTREGGVTVHDAMIVPCVAPKEDQDIIDRMLDELLEADPNADVSDLGTYGLGVLGLPRYSRLADDPRGPEGSFRVTKYMLPQTLRPEDFTGSAPYGDLLRDVRDLMAARGVIVAACPPLPPATTG